MHTVLAEIHMYVYTDITKAYYSTESKLCSIKVKTWVNVYWANPAKIACSWLASVVSTHVGMYTAHNAPFCHKCHWLPPALPALPHCMSAPSVSGAESVHLVVQGSLQKGKHTISGKYVHNTWFWSNALMLRSWHNNSYLLLHYTYIHSFIL